MSGVDPDAHAIVTLDELGLPSGLTPARLALGRAGSGLPTRPVLEFALAHAQARDAVHAGLDVSALGAAVEALGLEVVRVESAAPSREVYLRRPDFGRRLSRESRTVLAARTKAACDVLIVVGDGLSARAVAENALPVVTALATLLRAANVTLGPVVIATQARVALGDEVGSTLGARLVVVLIGERPGLSAADSLGGYVTFAPQVGRTDAERNCLSNIRTAGLTPAEAARSIAWLVRQAFALGLTGVRLKDESGGALPILPAAAQVPDGSL